jgi:serine/threonine protein kinase
MLKGEPPFISSDTRKILADVIKQDIKFPEYFSEQAIDLIKRLLHPNPKHRLGSGKSGVEDIKSHPFFEDVEWEKITAKRVAPPYVPLIKSESDTSHFDNVHSNLNTMSRYPSQSKIMNSDASDSNFYFNAFHGKLFTNFITITK